MNDDLRASAEAHGGHLTAADLRELGWSSRAVTALVRTGVLVRIRHGAYALRDQWESLDAVGRHLVLVGAVARRLDGRVAVCGLSSLLVRGTDVWDVDLSAVDVVRLDEGAGRNEAGVRHHVGHIEPTTLERVGGIVLVPASVATWQAMCTHDVEHGLVVADSSLNKKHVSEASLDEAAADGAHHRGALHAGITRRLADGRAVKPGETRSRYLCFRHNLPRPELQVPIIDPGGTQVAISDMVWEEHAHVAEFDGRVKYLGDLGPDDDRAAVLWAEKLREDAIRGCRWGVSRLVWSDLGPARRANTAEKLRNELRTSREYYGPLRRGRAS